MEKEAAEPPEETERLPKHPSADSRFFFIFYPSWWIDVG